MEPAALMTVHKSLQRRQLGLQAVTGANVLRVHQAEAFARKLTADVGLLKRLACCAEFDSHNGAVSGLAWNDDGSLLLTGGEDSKVRLWEPSVGTERANFSLVGACSLRS